MLNIYLYIYTYTHVIYIYIYAHVINIYIYTYTHVIYKYTYTHMLYIYIHIHVIYIYIYTCYIYIHTYIHIYRDPQHPALDPEPKPLQHQVADRPMTSALFAAKLPTDKPTSTKLPPISSGRSRGGTLW